MSHVGGEVLRFSILASGSHANTALIRTGRPGLLIDVGVGPREMEAHLARLGTSWEQIGLALLTHTHGDHVSQPTLRQMALRRIPLACHHEHRRALEYRPGFQQLEQAGLVCYFDDAPFLTPVGLWVEPIRLSHDAGATFGFRIEGAGKAGASRGRLNRAIGYVSDTGCWNRAIVEALSDVDLLCVEFNHDPDLQRQSLRAPFLIRRNLGQRGHLSNAQAAQLVEAVVQNSRRIVPRQLVLLHLSRDCNTPTLALQAARASLKRLGRRAQIHLCRDGEPLGLPDFDVTSGVRPRRADPIGPTPTERLILSCEAETLRSESIPF